MVLASALVPRGTESAHANSTIVTTQPVQGVPYSAGPIRDNFGRAASDITALQRMNAGATAPSSPTTGTLWLSTPGSGTTYTLNVWLAPASAWVPIARLNSASGAWMPPVGGGAIPSIVSASTTDLGSVPQAAVNITGAQTIASFGSSVPEGQVKFLTFTGAATLVYNATFMIVTGSANATMAPGQFAVALSLGGGKWRVDVINRATLLAYPTVNARDPAYGMLCNGTHDDTPALQAAITAAAAINAGVFISGNTNGTLATCMMNAPVSLASNFSLSADPGTVVLKATPTNTHNLGGILLSLTNLSNVRVNGLVLDGNAFNFTFVGTRLVFVNGGNNVVFDNNIFQNTVSVGIAFTGAATPITNSGVTNSKFYNIGMYWAQGGGGGLFANAKSGVNFASGAMPAEVNFNNFVFNNEFELIGADGINIVGQSHFVASNNRMALTGGWKPTAPGATLGVAGIYSQNSPVDFLIANNVIDGATSNSIDLGPNDTDADAVSIIGNVISNSGGAGISLGNMVKGFTITGNMIRNSYLSINDIVPNTIHQGAISFSCGSAIPPCMGAMSNGVIAGNTIIDNQTVPTTQYGIWADTGVSLSNITIASSNNISGTQVAAIGGAIVPLSPRNLATCASPSVGFTNQTPVNTEVYTAEILVPATVGINGVAIQRGTVSSGNVKVGLADSSGNVVATSASTLVTGADGDFQQVPFTSVFYAAAPATYYALTFYDNSTVRARSITTGNCGAGKLTGQTYATGFVSNVLLAPTTFTTALGPVANLY